MRYESGAYCCYPISEGGSLTDRRDVLGFELVHDGNEGILDYLREGAYRDDRNRTIRTYLVRDRVSEELAGVFSLCTGSFRSSGGASVRDLPSVELSCIAVNKRYVDAHPEAEGCGKVFFIDFVLPIVREVRERLGVSRMYLYAANDPDDTERKLIRTYEDYQFRVAPKGGGASAIGVSPSDTEDYVLMSLKL